MTARIIDGKAIAADLRGQVADAVHRLARDRGLVPGLAVVLVGNNPASESLCRQQGEDDRRQRHALVRPPAAGDHQRGRVAGAGRRLNADPGRARHPGAAAAAAADRRAEGDRRDRSGQGRRRLPSRQCRAVWSPGLPALAPCTPLGCMRLAKTVHAVARRARGGGDRPLQHRRQAAGAAAARRERDRDGRAFQDARPAGGVPPRRSAVRGGRPARDGAAATGSSRARR